MALFALGDIHLAFQRPEKSMDAMGPVWVRHEEKIWKNCQELVKPEDTLVLLGDHSWGRKMSQCREDLDFIARLPGRKILLRGNHDMFWEAQKTEALNVAYRGKLFFLQNNFAVYRDYALVGTKGFTFEGPFLINRYTGEVLSWDQERRNTPKNWSAGKPSVWRIPSGKLGKPDTGSSWYSSTIRPPTSWKRTASLPGWPKSTGRSR